MIEIRKIDCQGCNNSCPLTVSVENQKVTDVSGNCCHRGIVSAKTQIEMPSVLSTSSFTGHRKIYCSGCSNRCELDVTMVDGLVESLTGEGCRRGIISARKQLE